MRWLISETATIEYDDRENMRPASGAYGAAGSGAGGEWRSTSDAYGVTSWGAGGDWEEKVLLISDVSRAFLEAPTTRKIAVTLPEEALTQDEIGRGLVGILQMSLYGTRDAAVNFQ